MALHRSLCALPSGLDQPDDFTEGRRVTLDRAGPGRRLAPGGLERSGFGGGFHFNEFGIRADARGLFAGKSRETSGTVAKFTGRNHRVLSTSLNRYFLY